MFHALALIKLLAEELQIDIVDNVDHALHLIKPTLCLRFHKT